MYKNNEYHCTFVTIHGKIFDISTAAPLLTTLAYSLSKHDMAALRGQFRGLANDRNLRRFVVQARPTGRQLGTGSYGTVEEVIEKLMVKSCS